MSVFLGIGLGPIQTGIFIAGAAKGRFNKIVVAEVNPAIKEAVNSSGCITINIAAGDCVYQETYEDVTVYNPQDPADLECLIEAAAEADELATALPSVNFFPQVAEWLRKGFERHPEKRRFIYTAENNNHAAEEMEKALGKKFEHTHCLNTVIGKMSGVITAEECLMMKLKPLCPGADRGHLVEEFDRILISTVPEVEARKVVNLCVKPDLFPFEEAKLYGHNAIHFLLGILGDHAGKGFMSELRGMSGLMREARNAFINESGLALCRKWAGKDVLFTPDGITGYADDLLLRMTNPFLKDAIARIIRDLPRKLSWNDRVIGTMRLCLEHGVSPEILARGAALAAVRHCGGGRDEVSRGLKELWPQPWTAEHQRLMELILEKIT